MDWFTFSASVGSALLSGGAVGAVVALRVSTKESEDRREALSLERQKWEHEKAASAREQAREGCRAAVVALDSMMEWAARLRNSERKWKDRSASDDPETGEEVRGAYDKVSETNTQMPGLMTSVYAIPLGVASAAEASGLVKMLVSAQQAFGHYVLSCLQNEHDHELFRLFLSSHARAALEYKTMLARIG